jgi:hypothetical protein
MTETDTQLAPAPIVAEIVDEDERSTVTALEILERQLFALRALSVQVTDAATDMTAAVVEAPAHTIAAIRDGAATLPAALSCTTDALQDAAADVGSRLRAAVGSYVNAQAVLPNAVITGASEVAASAIRAQGDVVATVVDGAFTVAAVATQGGDIRDALDQEWQDLLDSAATARGDIHDAISVARQRIRGATP